MRPVKKRAEDYFYAFEELSGSERQRRLHHLAGELLALIRKRGGEVDRELALTTVAAKLNTVPAEVRRGIVLGEGQKFWLFSLCVVLRRRTWRSITTI